MADGNYTRTGGGPYQVGKAKRMESQRVPAKWVDTAAVALRDGFKAASAGCTGDAWLLIGDDNGQWWTVTARKGATRIAVLPPIVSDCLTASPGVYVLPSIRWGDWFGPEPAGIVTLKRDGDGWTRIERGRGWLRFNPQTVKLDGYDRNWQTRVPDLASLPLQFSPDELAKVCRKAAPADKAQAVADAANADPTAEKPRAASAKQRRDATGNAMWACASAATIGPAIAECGAVPLHYASPKSRAVMVGCGVVWVFHGA